MGKPANPVPRALVADIGGTNARFALADLETLDLSEIRQFPCAEHASIEGVAQTYVKGLKECPCQGAVAVAAPLAGHEIKLTNSVWSFTAESLASAANLDALLLLNDFEALALSLPHLRAAELHRIGGGAPAPEATKVVLGPGTGIGVAGLVWSGADWIAVPSEGGHISLAAHTRQEFELIERLRGARDHLSAERVLSGPGLANLYRAIADSRGVAAQPLQPNDVLTLGAAGSDPLAVEALTLFVTWLGAFAGDIALAFCARGGVYLGGGIAPKIANLLSQGAFRWAFEAKGRLRSLLTPIPVSVILAEFATLRGAAAGLRAKALPPPRAA
ncbi:glucokinase [Methyloceanibacter sp.]|uniref:glucokinase n=1 Tax=Methyloceanibacter sp. TaxID=1965321 RepID=UPI003D6D1421